MFDSLKNEFNKRKAENSEIKSAVQQEKQRIQTKRQKAKKNVLRKKFQAIDDFSTSQEQKRDERRLSKFELKQKEAVNKKRAKRRDQFLKANRGKIAIGCIIAFVLLMAIGLVYGHSQDKKLAENYASVINNVLSEDFSKAKKIISKIDSDANKEVAPDVKALMKYIKTQLLLDKCEGKPSEFVSDLESVTGLKNEEVIKQYEDALTQSKAAAGVQKEIDAIDLSSLTLESKDPLDKLSLEVEDLETRYKTLVNQKNLFKAQAAVTHMEDGDSIGKAMLAIAEIGKVSLKSDTAINAARWSYDALSKQEKKEVLNYEKLKIAEKKLASLQKEEKKRKAEAKARKEAETQQITRSMPGDSAESTVYITPTGGKYHSYGCRYLRGSKTAISKQDAINRGLEPCSRCSP